MPRVVVFACSVLALTGTSVAQETTIVTRSDGGQNYAKIIQTGPTDDKPVVVTRKGPGYVVIEQRSRRNRAVIIQGNPPGEE